MKRLIFLIFIISNLISFGQSSSTLNQEIPNQIPPTPETFKFAKYGEIPVNESSGNATLDIPLYMYKVGNISVPMNISHSGGAVRVDEASTWTGINWQLNVGGLISRTVNDLQDEDTSFNNRKFYTSEQLHSLTASQIIELNSNAVDSEVDIFNYSFGGYSGSFYLDENLVPRLIKYDKELKIELSGLPIINGITTFNKRTIIITIPDGSKYYFGGQNASEATRNGVISGGNAMPYVQTGFYLFKIENFLGDIATFNYAVWGGTEETVGYSQVLTKDISLDPPTVCSIVLGIHTFAPKPSRIEYSGKLKLISIDSNRDNSKVIFTSTTQLDKNVLENISVFSKYFMSNSIENKIHKKIAFDYLLPNGSYQNRFFLEKIKIYEGENTVTDNIHYFEYNNLNLLPARFSFSQDNLGYYNGKNNSTFVPKTDNVFLI